jgi:hypothetical protein
MVFAINKKLPPPALFFAAVIIYAVFAGWLFWPHLNKFAGSQRIFLIIPVVSAAGVFLLGRRYVNSFVACFFAGVIYGFGPFASAFYCGYHPFAALIYACLPWTFIPAVFLYKLPKAGDNKMVSLSNQTTNLLSAVLSLLPFIFIIACFALAAMPRYCLIPIPIGTAVSAKSFTAIVTPLSFSVDAFSVGFYHAPFGALIVGLVLFFKTRRFWTAALFVLAVCLSFYKPLLNVPAVFWLSLPVLICSIVCAEGFEAMTLAGKADSNWLLLSAAALIFQAGLNFALAKSPVFPLPVGLSAIAIIAVLLIFFIARSGLAMHLSRMAVLYISVFIDIVIVTRHIIDKIFG